MTKLKQEYINWFYQSKIPNPVFITFSEKQVFNSVNNYGENIKTYINNELSSKNFKHFSNLLNKKLFKKSFHRFNKRLQTFISHETTGDNRHHIHGIIEQPTWIDNIKFDKLVSELFAKTDYGYRHHHITRAHEHEDGLRGWVGYMLKEKTNNDFSLWVDLENCYLSS